MVLPEQTIVERIVEKINQTPAEAKNSIEHLIEIMKETLASGEDVMITNFGKFQVNEKAPCKGRNPTTGEDMVLDGRKVVTFRCAGVLRDLIMEIRIKLTSINSLNFNTYLTILTKEKFLKQVYKKI